MHAKTLTVVAVALFALLQEARSGSYYIKVISGRVKDEDNWPTGDSDPFVRLNINNEYYYTDYISDDNTPDWNQAGTYTVPDTTIVYLDAYDFDTFLTGNNDHLGSTNFPVTKTGDRNEGCCGGHIRIMSTWTPVNLCDSNNGECGVNSICTYTGDNRRTCACKAGYESATGKSCSRIYACRVSPNGGCGVNTNCVDTGPGTRRCDCKTGYERSSNGADCISINPCNKSPLYGDCGQNSACSHTGPNTNTCTCNSNYYGDSNGKNCQRITICSGGTFESQAPTSISDRVCSICTAGHKCLGGTSQPIPCGSITKYAGTGRASCLTVSSGYIAVGGTAQTRTGQQACPAGSFCVGGVKTPCASGTFQANTGKTSCDPCQGCPTGFSVQQACTSSSDTTCADTTSPTISLIGPASVNVEAVTGSYVELGATASDSADGTINTGKIIIKGAVDVNALGTYKLKYSVKDKAGNEAVTERTVIVVDTTPPSILLGNFADIEVEAGVTPYTLPEIKSTDLVDGDITAEMIIQGLQDLEDAVSQSILGTKDITYQSTDQAGNSVSATQKVNVVDTLAPVITLVGDRLFHVEATTVQETWVDPGYSAFDLGTGDITWSVVISGDVVDSSVPGVYTINYDVEDNGQEAQTVSRIVTVADTSPPVVTLNGENPITVEVLSVWNDPGYAAVDSFDGNLLVQAGAPDMSSIGTYIIEYKATNMANLIATKARTVYVVDRTLPSITLLGLSNMELEAAVDRFDDPGFSALDAYDGDLTSKVQVTQAINLNVPGDYDVAYFVSDSSGNSITIKRNVTMVDTTSPVITLQGNVTFIHEAATPFIDPGFGAVDFVDGGVNVNVEGSVDLFPTKTPITFSLTYSAIDQANNPAVSLTRTVIVVDRTPPIITITTPRVTLEGGNAFSPPNVVAQDTLDGEIPYTTEIYVEKLVNGTVKNVTVETVNILSPAGTLYFFHYSAQDAQGNHAENVVQILEIVDTTPPVITIFGHDEIEAYRPRRSVYSDGFAIDLLEGFIPKLNYSVRLLSTTSTNLTLPTTGGFEIIDTSLDLGTTWEINYTAVDSSGNSFTETRVKTLQDHKAPAITLNPLPIGRSSMNLRRSVEEQDWFIEINSTYVESGATAWDEYEGDVSDLINITGVVDTSTRGIYPVVYNITDNSGNQRAVIRQVFVISPQDGNEPEPSTGKSSSSNYTMIVIGCVCGVLACLAFLVIFLVLRNRRGKAIEKATAKGMKSGTEDDTQFMYSNPSYTAPHGMADTSVISSWEENSAYGMESSTMEDAYSIPMAKSPVDDYDTLIRFDDKAATVDGWFHGALSEEEATKRVAEGGDGTYLVRYASNTGRDFYITSIYDKVVRHHSVKLGKYCTIDNTPVPNSSGLNVADIVRMLRSDEQDVLPAPLKAPAVRSNSQQRSRDNPLYFDSIIPNPNCKYAQFLHSLEELDPGRPVYTAVETDGEVHYAEVDGRKALEVGCPLFVNLEENTYGVKTKPVMATPVGFDDGTLLPMSAANRTPCYEDVQQVVVERRATMDGPVYEMAGNSKPAYRDSGYIKVMKASKPKGDTTYSLASTGHNVDQTPTMYAVPSADSDQQADNDQQPQTYAIPTAVDVSSSSSSSQYFDPSTGAHTSNQYLDPSLGKNQVLVQSDNVAYTVPDDKSANANYGFSA